jgi:hypothetical protein
VYVCEGFCAVDVPPSPNDQIQVLGVFVVVSINWTPQGIVPEVVFTTNEATGVDAPDAGRTRSAARTMKKPHTMDTVFIVFLPKTVLLHIRVIGYKK